MYYRASRSLTTLDGEKHVSVDDSDLMYSRVSVTLMEDPDIQNAIFKSASAENLPKVNPALQVCTGVFIAILILFLIFLYQHDRHNSIT